MSEDIGRSLQAQMLNAQAVTIEALQNRCDLNAAQIDDLTKQIERLTVERDEARRWLCQRLEWFEGGDGTQAANERGWDCFKGQIYD